MRQLLYASVNADRASEGELATILEQSRHNNAIDGVSGLLYTNGERYVQVLEGPEESIGPTFDRIRADPRHQEIAILSDRTIEAREFGSWSMAHRGRRDPVDEFVDRMRHLIRRAAPDVQDAFLDLIAEGQAVR